MPNTVCMLLYAATPTDCAICADGNSKTVGHECTECKGAAQAAIYTGFAVVVALCIALLAFIAVQLLGLSDGHNAITNLAAFGCMKKLASLPWEKLHITVVVLQIITQFISISKLPLPDIYHKFLNWVALSNLDLGWLLSLGCVAKIDFYRKLLITTLGPFAVAAVLKCTYTVACYINKPQTVNANTSQLTRTARRLKLDEMLANHEMVFLVMTFLVYSTVSTTVFQSFSCDSVTNVGGYTTSYLRADYSILCTTSEHTAYRVYAVFMMCIYPLGIPALYALLLWRNKHKLRSTGSSDASVHMLNRHSDSTLRSTRFLWQSYTPNMYYWEVVECMRRLLLTSAMVFIVLGTAAQAAIACMLTVVGGFVTVYLRPHANALDSKFYVVGVVIVILSILMSLTLTTDIFYDKDHAENAAGTMLVGLNIVLMSSAVVQMYMVNRRANSTRESSLLDFNATAAVDISPAATPTAAAVREYDYSTVMHNTVEVIELRF
jgi:hypothetical protein